MNDDGSRWMKWIAVAVLAICVVSGCSGAPDRPDPKDTVKGLFTALKDSDTLYLTTHIDFELATPTLGEESFLLDSTGADLLGALTGEGALRKRWLDNQIVIGKSMTSTDTAWVEVSFIDRLTRVQYYNKMRLHYDNDHWVIDAFRTL